MSDDIFIRLKANAEKDIIGKDVGIAKAILSNRYMNLVLEDEKDKTRTNARLCAVVKIDDFRKVVEVVEWI